MSSLYVTAETNDSEYTLDQIFLGIAFEIEADDKNEDGTRTVHATWLGNCEHQIVHRCAGMNEIKDYQIIR